MGTEVVWNQMRDELSALQQRTHKLEAMLIECRSSVKFDLYRYEKMAIAYGRLGEEGKQTKEVASSEAKRLWKLLDAIDGLTETNGVA